MGVSNIAQSLNGHAFAADIEKRKPAQLPRKVPTQAQQIANLLARVEVLERMTNISSFKNYSQLSPAMQKIIDQECRKAGLCPYQVLGERGNTHISNCRHEIWYRFIDELGMTKCHVGRIFDRDHTSVIHACNKRKRAGV